jgi:hypothetical protein
MREKPAGAIGAAIAGWTAGLLLLDSTGINPLENGIFIP